METTSFILGILSVVGMITVILAVYSFVKINTLNKKIVELESEYNNRFDNAYNQINTHSELDNRRIDGEIDRTDHMIKELYRYVDSRVDKMDSSLVSYVESKFQSLDKQKQLIKG